MPDKQRLGVRRSWRAGADCKSVGLSLSWFESSHSHQNKNTRASGVFIFVKCGIGFESRNHLIAGLTMSCCVTRCAWHTTYECPAVPRHQRGRGNQPLPPLKQPPNGGFFSDLEWAEMRISGKSLRSKRAGSCQRRKGPTASRWELQSSHSHQNKTTHERGWFCFSYSVISTLSI